jgi:hypothetical protein
MMIASNVEPRRNHVKADGYSGDKCSAKEKRLFFGYNFRSVRLPLLVYEQRLLFRTPLAGLLTFGQSFSKRNFASIEEDRSTITRPANRLRDEKGCPYSSKPAQSKQNAQPIKILPNDRAINFLCLNPFTHPVMFDFPVTARPSAAPVISTRFYWLLFFALGLGVPLLYVHFTHHVWEDFLITFRHSRNLVEGKGLVYNPGQRVQGFTSAINAMLPAIFYYFSGRSYDAALNLYRAACLLMYFGGGAIVLRAMLRDPGIDRLSPLIFILLFTTEAQSVAYTMSGQESSFMVGFLALGFYACYRGLGRSWPITAVSWTGLFYTRPDAWIFIFAIVFAGFIFRIEDVREVLRSIAKAAAVAILLFAPWFIWAWIYYGQPIPNTVLAKSLFGEPLYHNPPRLIQQVFASYMFTSAWIFQPIYAAFGGWPDPLLDAYGLICSGLATIYWIVPSNDRLGRLASLLFTLCTLYLSLVNVSAYAAPWYLPSAAIFGVIAVSRAPLLFAGRLPILRRRAVFSTRLLQTALVAVSIYLMIGQTLEIRIQQQEIEENHRKKIGLYLHEVMQPDQNVYLEPIGYIGYYSDRTVLDWPGLVAPQIVQIRREHHVDEETLIPYLMPDWMVLRPDEERAAFNIPEVRDRYTIMRTFDARPNLDKYSYIPGRGYLMGDSVFFVLKRNDVQPAIPLN